jgi:hypothetical protein
LRIFVRGDTYYKKGLQIPISLNIENKDKMGAYIIRKRWAEIYENYKDFKPSKYCIDNGSPVVYSTGFLNIEWTEEMNDFDFLIAIPVVLTIHSLLTAEEITSKMVQNNYFEYFKNNLAWGIITFQYREIKQLLDK